MPFIPTNYQPPSPDTPALISYLSASNPGYYSEFQRHMGQANGTDKREFGQWLKDHLAATPEDSLWQDKAISAYAKGGAFVAPAPTTGQGGSPTPPAPDAPVQAGDTLLKPPTPTAPIPPVSERSSDVIQAGRDARRQAKKKKGYSATLLAGETGGAINPVKTLLGTS